MSQTIGLFWGSDTGVTEEIVTLIKDELGARVDVIHVFDAPVEDFDKYEHIILGLSTWYDGELQSDWDAFFEEFQRIDFSQKKIAIFGTGDQEGYAEYFVDGIGILGEVVEQNGGQLIGRVSTEGYTFEASKALDKNGLFMGLPIDEDNQPALTDERLQAWLHQILIEFEQVEA